MNAIRGAVGLLFLETGFWLTPADHDPAFRALPITWQALILLALVLLFLAGLLIFAWGVFAVEPWKQEEKAVMNEREQE